MLSRPLQAFIQGAFRSVWAVELLVVLRRASDRAWTPDELVRELRGSAALVAENLQRLAAAGIVEEVAPGRFGYRPASTVVESLCDELEREYRRRPVTVINAVVSGAVSKVQGLADSFRFRDTDK